MSRPRSRPHRPRRSPTAVRRPAIAWGIAAALSAALVIAWVFFWTPAAHQQEPATSVLQVEPASARPVGMVWIPPGEFTMGSTEEMFADARPTHRVAVDGFWMDATEVTNASFSQFVDATGYVTVAEQAPRAEDYPGAPPDLLVPGSVVFTAPHAPVPLDNPLTWWRFVPGATWRHPEGPGSTIADRMDHPVVHVAYDDALAYAGWVGRRLPTEAEWERAARGGEEGRTFVWGDEEHPGGAHMANVHQGDFPHHNSAADGYVATAPVAAFPANEFGLYGMSGNVWEWTTDWYRSDTYAQRVAASPRGGVVRNPRGPSTSHDPSEPGTPKRVQKGGSFLCTDQYCGRYRPGGRGKGEPGSGSNHAGFRTVVAPSGTVAARGSLLSP